MSLQDEILALKSGDLIQPVALVEWARRHKDSLLHREFEWRNGKAAHEYRLIQARRLIVLHVQTEDQRPVVISLIRDRVQPGGGYRKIEQVMSIADMRREALGMALAELRRVRDKYNYLKELACISQEIDRAYGAHFPAEAPAMAAAKRGK